MEKTAKEQPRAYELVIIGTILVGAIFAFAYLATQVVVTTANNI